MVRKPDIQYVRYYTDGSSAKALQLFPAKRKAALPRAKKNKIHVIHFDPLAYAGIAVAVVMLVLMLVNCFQLKQLQNQTDAMCSYVDVLKEENARLSDTYEKGYDLMDIKKKALAMGMVPMDEVRHISVPVEVPAEQAESGSGNWAFLTDISE